MSSTKGPLINNFPEVAEQMHKSIGELKEDEKTLSTFLTSAAQQ